MTRCLAFTLPILLAVQACGEQPSSSGSMSSGAGGAQAPTSSGPSKPPGASGSMSGNSGKGQPSAPGKPSGGMSGTPVVPGAPAAAEQALSTKPRVADPMVGSADREALAKSNRAFAFRLYGALGAASTGNLFFSPYSVSSALAMTYAGARGTTAEQMRATLHFELPGDRLHAAFNAADHALTTPPSGLQDGAQPFTLDVANAMWAQRGKSFSSDYLDTLAANYGAGVQLLDFMRDSEGARRTINGWVEDKTHDRIKDLLQPGDLSADTVFVLTNAIYFKAKWQHDFSESATKAGMFHAAGGDQSAMMMHALIGATYAKGDGYQAVILPYDASTSEMVLILPDAGKVAALEGRLDETLWQALGSGASGAMVDLTLPRFRFESRFEVADVLSKLGMPEAFTPAADFSGMDGAHDIELSKVVHKAFVSVDEKGTEAAAATAVVGVLTSAPAPMPAVTVVFDRPFVVLIRERTKGDLLFMGRVASVAQ